MSTRKTNQQRSAQCYVRSYSFAERQQQGDIACKCCTTEEARVSQKECEDARPQGAKSEAYPQAEERVVFRAASENERRASKTYLARPTATFVLLWLTLYLSGLTDEESYSRGQLSRGTCCEVGVHGGLLKEGCKYEPTRKDDVVQRGVKKPRLSLDPPPSSQPLCTHLMA